MPQWQSISTHLVIPLAESYKFWRIQNEHVDAICQTIEAKHDTECQTNTEETARGHDTDGQTASIEEEDTSMFRKYIQKVMDIDFLAAETRRGRNPSPLMNLIKQQKWDNNKDCYGPYVYNMRHRLSVRDNILLYHDRVVIPKQLRATLMDALHLTHPGQGGILEAAKHV